jgi:hypothetical protein
MAKSSCRFLVPTNYNDGRPVEPEFFHKMHLEIRRAFGAYRVLQPTEGCWEGQVELTIEYEVAVFPRRIPELRALVRRIGKDLGQTAMYFNAPPPTVEIMDVATGEDEEDTAENEGIAQ